MTRLRYFHKATIIIVAMALSTLMNTDGECSVTGYCDDCHVMHASIQGSLTPAAGPQVYLMKNTCLGCHTNTGGIAAPYVMNSATDLAGGDFEDLDLHPENGHNPVGVGVGVVSPPGWVIGFAANGQVGGGSAWGAQQLTCDGVWGCHGQHTTTGIKGAHHNNPVAQPAIADNEIGNGYRFLYKIKGYEDADYEAETATNHNVYYGVNRNADSPSDTQTISYLCSECHGIFHSDGGGDAAAEGVDEGEMGTFASPWIRHPVDFSMRDTGEYVGYDTYLPLAPLASTTLTAIQHTTGTTSVSGDNNRIVMCLSCHRAHASPYFASMRWNYRGTAGSWTNGCAYCHTSKN